MSMFAYANDNGGKYPDGGSSTEVFQKLIDASYISDPAILYFPLPGKVKAVTGQKLKPENVCFDITGGATVNDSDSLPLVFWTGYKVSYVPGGSAKFLIKPSPKYYDFPQSWSDWWNGYPVQRRRLDDGLAVTYKDNSTRFMLVKAHTDTEGTIPNFVPHDFDPRGKTYRQLTPDGILP